MLPQEEKSQSTKDQQPLRVTPRHRALMRRLVSGMNLSNACDDLGFSLPRASVIVNSPLFQAEMKEMEKELSDKFIESEASKESDPTRLELMESREIAAKTLRSALDDENPHVRITAAKDILDRTGYAKEDKIQARILVEPSQSLLDVVMRIAKEKNAGADRPDKT